MPPSHKRRLLVTALATALAIIGGLLAPIAAHASPPAQYTNPLVAQRADPHIFRHTDGYYYFTATVPEYDRIVLRRATTIQGLASAAETVIWRRHTSGDMGAHIWAPEIHFINGKWYVYFAAGRADDIWRIRMYVLESSAANPLTGTWTERGRITTPWDTFALDATTFVANGVRYLLWAQQEPGIATNSNLYIARMGANPWTITGAVTRLTVPTLAWETRGYKVAEGPAVLQRNGRLFLTYSASATDANYCLGMLTASASADPLQASSWTKSANPVFVTNAVDRPVRPRPQLLHHLRGRAERHPRLPRPQLSRHHRRPAQRPQPPYPRPEGLLEGRRHPRLRHPGPRRRDPRTADVPRHPGPAVRHWEYRARLEANVSPLADSQFRLVTGLSGSGTVSLESTNFPGYYLRHRNHEAWVERNDGTSLFSADASFTRRTGLAGSGTVSLESVNFPGHYLRHRAGQVWVEQNDGTGSFRGNAGFVLE